MPLAYDDFIFPPGRLKRNMFAEQDLDTVTKRLLEHARERVTDLGVPVANQTATITALVYWLAFTALADDNATEGSEQRDGDVVTKWSVEDRQRFNDEALKYGNIYNGILDSLGIVDPLAPEKPADPLPILQAWMVSG